MGKTQDYSDNMNITKNEIMDSYEILSEKIEEGQRNKGDTA